jgi:hypothetical protein
VEDLFLFRVPMPLLTVEAAGLYAKLVELGTVLGVEGFDRPPPPPSSTGWTVCFEELLDVSLGSAIVVGDELLDGGISLEPLPASALACDAAAAPAALFLHMQTSSLQNSVTFTTHIDQYLLGLISTCVNILVFGGDTVLYG